MWLQLVFLSYADSLFRVLVRASVNTLSDHLSPELIHVGLTIGSIALFLLILSPGMVELCDLLTSSLVLCGCIGTRPGGVCQLMCYSVLGSSVGDVLKSTVIVVFLIVSLKLSLWLIKVLT